MEVSPLVLCRLSGDDKPGGAVTAVIQKVVGTFQNLKTAILKQSADFLRVMDGFTDVFLEGQVTILKDPDFQVHLAFGGAGHLEPDTEMIIEIHLKGFAGGYFVFVENVENEMPPGGGIGVHILEDFLNIGEVADVIDGIAGAGDQVKFLLRTVGDHICHIVMDFR